MPLYEKKKFIRIKPPDDLKPNEELYYCKLTHEVFRDYEAFFERVILLNSLVWTCSLTGKTNLTFQEALESEEAARYCLRTFPIGLKKPILYLASLTQRTRLNDMCDDVFSYVKDRYFVGEEVEVQINGVKKSCEITQVILPERAQKSPVKSDKPKKVKETPPSRIKYEVVNYDTGKTLVVKSDVVSRPKGVYTKPKNKLYIRHHTNSKNGSWKVKEKSAAKLNLDEFQFDDAFAGQPPSYSPSPSKKKQTSSDKNKTPKKQASDNASPSKKNVQSKLNFKKETAEEKKKNAEKQVLDEKQRIAVVKERQKAKEDLKKQMEESREKEREKKLLERQKKKEEKKLIAEYISSWKKPRDDLECDDLKELPVPTPIDCGIPPHCFGDALMFLEFLNTFEKEIRVKSVFSAGLSFEKLEKALVETDIQGVFNDLLQLLLTALFRLQQPYTVELKTDNRLNGFYCDDNMTPEKVKLLGSNVSSWAKKYHGTLLQKIPIDSFSVSEILRQHILICGRKGYAQRLSGLSEDPALNFVMEEHELMNVLATNSVFHLSCEDRMKILTLLMYQLLNSDTLKFVIDENIERTWVLRHELKMLKAEYLRKLKEDSQSSKKKQKDNISNADKIPNADNVPNGTLEESKEGTPVIDDDEKENTDDLSSEEKVKLEQKETQAAKLKTEFHQNQKEILDQIRKLQSQYNIKPLGRDRAYRRYWIFQSIPGVFVEDDDPFKGKCLPKQTIQMTSSNPLPMRNETSSTSSIKKYIQQIGQNKNGSSDKENEILRDLAIVQNDISSPVKNRKLSDLNLRIDSKKTILNNSSCLQCKNKVDNHRNTWYCPHSKNSFPLDQCTANIDTCPVHNINAPQTKWAFYYTIEEIDALISNLNVRGFRENSLKDALISKKERIQEMLAKCPSHLFNKSLPMQSYFEIRKSQRHQSSHSSPYSNMLPSKALEVTLRDSLLELEHRIYAGGLGSIKVKDHQAWKTAIENGTYDKQCDNLVWKPHEVSKTEDEPIKSLAFAPVVKDMASALLQISQGIENRYLNPPLGESEEVKKAKQKNNDNSKEHENRKDGILTPLEMWQQSLMECVSMPQLFVHLGTLEASIAWSRSVLNAHCRICRRRGDAENMLLCDGCNRGHHLYCLKPPLKAIPEGDWFCVRCKPIETPVATVKKQAINYAESENDMDTDSSENESGSEDEMDEGEEEDEVEDSVDQTIVEESCEACGDVGTLLCCDKCPLMYHPECVNLKRIPRGEWLCPKCTKKEEAIKKAQKHPSSGSYGTRSHTLTSHSSLKTKIAIQKKGVKRKYEESYETDFEPPSKRSKDKKLYNEDSDKEENTFKKNYKDSLNSSRRRSKIGTDGDMLDYKTCYDLLAELMHHPSSWPFLVPVSKKDAPDYHLVIKRPMDFGTIRSKLNFMSYRNNEDFVRDVYLVLQNCEWFNPKSSEEYKAAQVLYKEVKRLLTEYNLCNPFEKEKFHDVNQS